MPTNLDGKATIQQHIRGSEPMKSQSPFTSMSAELGTDKSYGDHHICVDWHALEQDIDSGVVDNVEIITHEEVIANLQEIIAAIQATSSQPLTGKNKKRLDSAKQDLANATRDKEILIKGMVPAKYVTLTKKP